jgi:hypothetical protein
MDVSFPEHRLYSILCVLQAGIVMIGTVAIRFVTGDLAFTIYQPAPAIAMVMRHWGFVFLLVPAGCLAWSIRASQRDESDERMGARMALGTGVTIALGLFFWWVWDRSTIHHHGVTEMGNF